MSAFLFYTFTKFSIDTSHGKNIRPYLDHHPQIDPSCYIDEMSVVVGDVKLAENVSVWPLQSFAEM